jgi:hypothetical protein
VAQLVDTASSGPKYAKWEVDQMNSYRDINERHEHRHTDTWLYTHTD